MSQKVQVMLLCDLEDGKAEAQETIQFMVGNASYEIDVCAEHAQQIRARLEPFVAHARKVAGSVTVGRRRHDRSASNREQNASIRAWAKDRGIQVSERGRIPASLVQEYEQTH